MRYDEDTITPEERAIEGTSSASVRDASAASADDYKPGDRVTLHFVGTDEQCVITSVGSTLMKARSPVSPFRVDATPPTPHSDTQERVVCDEGVGARVPPS